MWHRIYKVALLVVVVFALFSSSGSAASVAYRVHLEPQKQARTWRSPQSFRSGVEIRAFTEGDELHQDLSSSGCSAIYEGRGVRLVVRVCGSPHFEVRYASPRPEPGVVTLVYRSWAVPS